jgi:hypothetical protein
MQKTHDDIVCAAVRILPSEYTCDHLCDFDVVPGHHPSFRATMLREMLDQIMEMIQHTHDSIEITQTARDTSVIVTLTYQPGYFTIEHPFQDFILWIEGLWRRGLANYHHVKRQQIKSQARC